MFSAFNCTVNVQNPNVQNWNNAEIQMQVCTIFSKKQGRFWKINCFKQSSLVSISAYFLILLQTELDPPVQNPNYSECPKSKLLSTHLNAKGRVLASPPLVAYALRSIFAPPLRKFKSFVLPSTWHLKDPHDVLKFSAGGANQLENLKTKGSSTFAIFFLRQDFQSRSSSA